MCWTECKHRGNVDTCRAYLQSGASCDVEENYDQLLRTHTRHNGMVSHLCRGNMSGQNESVAGYLLQ